MDKSNLLPLDVLPSLNLEKTGEFQKLLYAFLLHFFYWSLAFRLVLLNACTWSYKVLRQVGKVFSSQKDFEICQCKSVLKFMYLSWVLIRRFFGVYRYTCIHKLSWNGHISIQIVSSFCIHFIWNTFCSSIRRPFPVIKKMCLKSSSIKMANKNDLQRFLCLLISFALSFANLTHI